MPCPVSILVPSGHERMMRRNLSRSDLRKWLNAKTAVGVVMIAVEVVTVGGEIVEVEAKETFLEIVMAVARVVEIAVSMDVEGISVVNVRRWLCQNICQEN